MSILLAFVVRKEVANRDDMSDVDDVDLGYRRHPTYRSADRRDRKVAKEMTG